MDGERIRAKGSVVDEILDLIAEAARTSPHARRAYELLRNESDGDIIPLAARQMIISGRMEGLPL